MRRDKRGEKKSGGKGEGREGRKGEGKKGERKEGKGREGRERGGLKNPLVVLYSLYRTLSTQCFRMSVKLTTM